MIISEDELLKITGYKTRGRLALCLRHQSIPYFIGKQGQIWTTEVALDAVLRGDIDQSPQELDFE
jgi:hypothetical protein